MPSYFLIIPFPDEVKDRLIAEPFRRLDLVPFDVFKDGVKHHAIDRRLYVIVDIAVALLEQFANLSADRGRQGVQGAASQLVRPDNRHHAMARLVSLALSGPEQLPLDRGDEDISHGYADAGCQTVAGRGTLLRSRDRLRTRLQ